ncbi:MAG: hypothetical protein ABW072_14925 [Sedimenticola sp.]
MEKEDSMDDKYQIPVQQETILEYLKSHHLQHCPAWFAGSLVEGVGNASSDVDVYIVADSIDAHPNYVTSTADYKIDIQYIDGIRVDYEIWRRDAVTGLAKRLDQLPLDSLDNNVIDSFNENEIDFIHRIFYRQDIGNAGEISSLAALFNDDRLKRYLIENKRMYLDDAYDDAVGMLESGFTKASVLRSVEALGFAVDMLLYANGFTNTKEKHRVTFYSRLAQNNELLSEYFMYYWQFISSKPTAEKAQMRYVRMLLKWVERFVALSYKKMEVL